MNLSKLLVLLCMFQILSACQAASKPKENEGHAKDPPLLTKPEVKKIWVPAAIEEEGKVYRDGYYKWILEKGTLWSQ